MSNSKEGENMVLPTDLLVDSPANSLEVAVLESTLNRALIINSYLFMEELGGEWVYIGIKVKKGKKNSAVRLYNKFFEPKPAHLNLGVDEKNFYPHQTLPTKVGQRLTELYELYKSRKNNRNNHNNCRHAA